MSVTFEEAAKRILICGADDVQYVLPKHDVGMVFITKPYLSNIDYKGLETHVCYIPNHSHKEYTPQIDRNNQDVGVAINFLEENPDKYLLVHCNAGVGVSPSFVFMLLVRLQGSLPDFDKAIRTVHSMTIDAMLDIVDYEPYLPISLEEAVKLKEDHTLAQRMRIKYREAGDFQSAFNALAINPRSEEDVLSACRRFGFHVEQGPKRPDQSGIINAIRSTFVRQPA